MRLQLPLVRLDELAESVPVPGPGKVKHVHGHADIMALAPVAGNPVRAKWYPGRRYPEPAQLTAGPVSIPATERSNHDDRFDNWLDTIGDLS
jgi:hypothetical protein